MPSQMLNLENTQAFDQLRVALVGKEKSGKSRLAATGRKPVLFFDFDGRAASVAGVKNAYAISYLDQTGTKQPDAFTDFIGHLSTLEANNFDLASLNPELFSVGTIVKTIVLDSITTMASDAMRYIKFTGGKTMGRAVSFGGMTVNFPAGFDAWNAEMATVEDCLLRVFASNKDVIVTFHETPEESPESTIDKPIFTGRVGIFPVRYQRLLRYFNEVWRISRTMSTDGTAQGAVPTVSMVPDYGFALGASTLNVGASEVPDIQQIIAKHSANGATRPASSQVLTSAQNVPVHSLATLPGVVMVPDATKK